MLFTDDASRHNYHQAPALLQVACQILESHVANYSVQVELIDCDRQGGLWIAALGLTEDLPADALEHIAIQVNNTFKRTDEIPTCLVECADVGLFSIRVSDRQDYGLLT